MVMHISVKDNGVVSGRAVLPANIFDYLVLEHFSSELSHCCPSWGRRCGLPVHQVSFSSVPGITSVPLCDE